MRLSPLLLAATLIAIIPSSASAETITVVGWNLESGGAKAGTLNNIVEDAEGVDIWGFSEVEAGWRSTFVVAAEKGEDSDFASVLGTTGGADRLMIVYNKDRLDLVGHEELNDINALGRVRAPLVAHFKLKSTGQEFLFVVNHLYRSRAEQRHIQSRQLNAWAAAQTLPVIATGDYNYDWGLADGDFDHDEGYDNLTANEVFMWVRPAVLIKTHCSNYNSVLDFVFASGSAQGWAPVSNIMESQEDYCPDDDNTSDHRPVRATFDLRGTPEGKAAILERIGRIEHELQSLKQAVEQLP